jgi:hypothetical protein
MQVTAALSATALGKQCLRISVFSSLCMEQKLSRSPMTEPSAQVRIDLYSVSRTVRAMVKAFNFPWPIFSQHHIYSNTKCYESYANSWLVLTSPLNLCFAGQHPINPAGQILTKVRLSLSSCNCNWQLAVATLNLRQRSHHKITILVHLCISGPQQQCAVCAQNGSVCAHHAHNPDIMLTV